MEYLYNFVADLITNIFFDDDSKESLDSKES
jgi:hypothetical protein